MSAGNPGFAAVEPGRPTVPLSPPQVIWADLGSEKKRHQRLTEVAKKEAFSVVCLLSLRSLSQACPVGDTLQRWETTQSVSVAQPLAVHKLQQHEFRLGRLGKGRTNCHGLFITLRDSVVFRRVSFQGRLLSWVPV